MRRMAVVLALALGLASPHPAGAEERRPKKPPVPRAEALRARGVSEKDQALLESRKVLVTNEAWKQVFSPYLERDFPVFVTADSLLHAYHVLLEESLTQRERALARRLPAALQGIWDELPRAASGAKEDPALVSRAVRRARLVLGVALRLAGGAPTGAPALEPAIEEEARRVEAATGLSLPEWLGPPRPDFLAIDHGRFLPRGLWAGDERLRRHFRAVAWLEAIPFRISSDEELLAVLLLAEAGSGQPLAEVLGGSRAFLGPADDFDLLRAAGELPAGGAPDLARARRNLLAEASRIGVPRISDAVTVAPPADPAVVAEPCVRIVAASRTVDGTLFQRTTDLRRFTPQPRPTGLEVAAALGSSAAREALAASVPEGRGRTDLLAEVDGARPLVLADQSLRGEYLRCVAALLDDPDPGAPALASGAAWKAKSLNAALAGWAQMRHAFVLQEKVSAAYLALIDIEPGFVEPDPEFFARLGSLARRTASLLGSSGILEPTPESAAVLLEETADQLATMASSRDPDSSERIWYLKSCKSLEALELMDRDAWAFKKEGKPRVLAEIRSLASDIRTGRLSSHPKIRDLVRYLTGDLKGRWALLAELAGQLEGMARKQLAAVPFTKEEVDLLHDYGMTLGLLMLYEGNSYLSPRDDAPRVVDVFSDPGAGSVVLAGIDRPRTIYVLYPKGDGEVLCRGAVLPYLEFSHPSRLDDGAWRTLLDGEARPPAPAWMAPLVGEEGIRKAVPVER